MSKPSRPRPDTPRGNRAPIVLGGSGFSILPEAFLKETARTTASVGEGSPSFAASFRAAQGRYPKERIIGGAQALTGTDIPSACYDPDLMRFYLERGHMAAIQTKRGCAHHAIYCTYPMLRAMRSGDATPRML